MRIWIEIQDTTTSQRPSEAQREANSKARAAADDAGSKFAFSDEPNGLQAQSTGAAAEAKTSRMRSCETEPP